MGQQEDTAGLFSTAVKQDGAKEWSFSEIETCLHLAHRSEHAARGLVIREIGYIDLQERYFCRWFLYIEGVRGIRRSQAETQRIMIAQ